MEQLFWGKKDKNIVIFGNEKQKNLNAAFLLCQNLTQKSVHSDFPITNCKLVFFKAMQLNSLFHYRCELKSIGKRKSKQKRKIAQHLVSILLNDSKKLQRIRTERVDPSCMEIIIVLIMHVLFH